jgi:hypothetical protein
MKPPEQVKGNLVGQEGIYSGHDGYPYRAEDEDESLAVDVGNASPQEEEAAKREGVGGDDPLQPTLWDVELATDGGHDDDDTLTGEGLRMKNSQLYSVIICMNDESLLGTAKVSAHVEKGGASDCEDQSDAAEFRKGQLLSIHTFIRVVALHFGRGLDIVTTVSRGRNCWKPHDFVLGGVMVVALCVCGGNAHPL